MTDKMTLLERIETLPDPRQEAKCQYKFGEVIFMTICGILCGADDWPSIQLFSETKHDWFKKYLKLEHGIPSDDTFNRVFSLLDPATFREMFTLWVQEMLLETPLSGVIAIDGKTVRGSRKGKSAGIHMVNAWATESGLALGQLKIDAKSNEITAVPELLDTLAIEGCLVTADAMSCQKKIATKIQKKGADYLLAVKKNQRNLHGEIEQQIENYWSSTPQDSPSDVAFSEQSNETHGRGEHRRCWALHDMSCFPVAQSWGAKTVAAIQLERHTSQKGKSFIRYFISSKVLSPEAIIQATRDHWHVENSLHWVLDVAFCEDQSRARAGYAAENLATARQVALNLLKRDTSCKLGIKNKRKGCGWSESYLCHVLGLIIE